MEAKPREYPDLLRAPAASTLRQNDRGPAASHVSSRLQRSNPSSVSGRAQQISTFPSAGGSSGSGSYHTDPPINAHSHVWQTPVRHDHFTRTSQASANSSRLWYVGLHGTSRPLRAKETMGPGPAAPSGGCGGWEGALQIPGVTDSSGPKTSWCNRPLG